MKKVLYACGALVALIATGPSLAADLAVEQCRLSTRPMIGRGFILARMRVGGGATTPASVPTVSLGAASSATTNNGALGLGGWNSTSPPPTSTGRRTALL